MLVGLSSKFLWQRSPHRILKDITEQFEDVINNWKVESISEETEIVRRVSFGVFTKHQNYSEWVKNGNNFE